jgi:hypothetical protein
MGPDRGASLVEIKNLKSGELDEALSGRSVPQLELEGLMPREVCYDSLNLKFIPRKSK